MAKQTFLPFNYYGIKGIRFFDFTDKVGSVKQYVAYMLSRTQAMFEYKGLPDTLPHRDFELLLQTNGFACLTRVKDGKVDLKNGDLYAFFGGLGGEYNAYYMPTKCVVANPALKFNAELTVNEDCVIIPNDALYVGLMPMFNRYASMLAENDATIRLADINARIISLITADDDRVRKSAEQYIRDIETGKLGVIADAAFFDGLKTQPYASSGTTNNITQLIELQQYLKASWFNDLGLRANYNMKRESINSNEAQLDTDALLPFIDDMYNQRKKGLERVRDVLGIEITVDYASSWKDRQIEEAQATKEPEKTETEETENEND